MEFVVLAEEVEAEHCCTVEAGGGSSWHVATLAPVFAPVDGLVSVVVLDPEHSFAESAANSTRQEVFASALAGCVGPLSGIKLGFGDQRVVEPRVPVVVMFDVPVVDAVEGDGADGAVVDPGAFLDRPVSQALGTTALVWAYQWAVVREKLGQEPTVDQVAEWWSMNRRTAFRDQASFRAAFPMLDTPAQIYASPEVREALKKHADVGDKVDTVLGKARSLIQDRGAIEIGMLPANL